MKPVGAFFCPTARALAATLFRAPESPEKHLNGVVYRRTGLDDGPRYLPESNAGPRYLPTRGPLGPMVTNGVSYDGI